MEADFTIDADPAQDLVRITLRGFFSPADVERLREAMATMHRRRRGPPNRHLTLVDVSGLAIQSQASVAAFGDLLSAPAYQARRLAMVVGRSLTRGQTMRAIAGRQARCFSTTAEAEAWLAAADRDVDAA